MPSLAALFALMVISLALLAFRTALILPRGSGRPLRPRKGQPISLAVFLGSGGHTAEMRTLLSALDRQKYARRTYVVGAGDNLSLRAVAELESVGEGVMGGSYSVLELPRARAVGQGWASTVLSAARTLAVALIHCGGVSGRWADVLLLNGPGTGVVLVLALYVRRVSRVTIQIANASSPDPRPTIHPHRVRRVLCARQELVPLGKNSAPARRHVCRAVARGCGQVEYLEYIQYVQYGNAG